MRDLGTHNMSVEMIMFEILKVAKTDDFQAVADILKEIHHALNENRPEYYVIPQDPALIPQEFLLFENSGSDDLEDVVDSQFQMARFTIKVPWLDAVMGCAVECGGGSAWAKPLETDWKEYEMDSVPWDNGWFSLMQEQTQVAIECSAGRYPVGPVHLRGMGDLIAALMGQSEFCLALYDYPEIIRKIIDIYVEVWVKIVRSQFQLLQPESGGYWMGNQPISFSCC